VFVGCTRPVRTTAAVLQEEASSKESGWEMMLTALELQLVPFVEDWLLQNQDFMAATVELSQ